MNTPTPTHTHTHSVTLPRFPIVAVFTCCAVTITAANNFKAFSGSGYKMTGAEAPRAAPTNRATAPPVAEMDREFLRRQRLAKFEQQQQQQQDPEAASKDK
eukprot:695393-Pyramimonas_sp.AAC.1